MFEGWQLIRHRLMKRWQEVGLLILILLIAAALRLTGIDWDDYQHYHPDERYITWVATTIERPSTLQSAFTPNQSSFNPYYWPPAAESHGIVVPQDEARKFAYGHVPLYLGVLATRFMETIGPPLAERLPAEWLLTRDLLNRAEWIEFRHLTAVARALTALFDVGTVLLVYLLGKAVYGRYVGLLAAAFLAVNVMHIQLSHFFISDPFLTFFVVAAILFMVASGKRRPEVAASDDQRSRQVTDYRLPITLFLAATMTGLAVGSKFAAILLFLPLALTLFMAMGEKWKRWLVTAVFISFLTFFITNPFAVLDFSCDVLTPMTQVGPFQIPALNWRSCYLENIVTQNAMVNGRSDVAFTRQYIGTRPYLYFIEMQLRWGMGLLLGLAAFAGFGWAIWQGFKPIWNWMKNREIRDWRLGIQQAVSNLQSPTPNLSIYILLAWTVPYFLTTGAFHVKFMRYLQPLTPFLMIYGAAMLLSVRPKWVRRGLVTAVLVFTSLFAVSFVNLYQQPHPWNEGSRWIFENAQPGSLILSEQWDDALPSSLLVNGEPRLRSEYRNEELTWLTYADGRDTEERLEQNLARLASADYLTITSNRAYGVVPKLDGRYPLSSQYHQKLFDGSLGYEPAFMVTRSPNLFGVRLMADTFADAGLTPPKITAALKAAQPTYYLGRADESFIVYDQPLLIIFENTGQLSVEEMKALFEIP